jgi:hypothetical protein
VSPSPAHSRFPEPDGRFHRAADEAARLGDAEVERRLGLFGQHLVGRDRHEDVGGLHRDLEVQEIVVFQDPDMVEARFHHRVGTGLAILVEEVLFEAPGIHPDPDRAIMVAGGLDDLLHPLLVADIAWVDPEAGRAGLRRLDPAFVVEMDVGHDGHGAFADDLLQGLRRCLIWHRDAHDVGARLGAGLNLRNRRLHVGRQRVRHGLHGDRRVAPHGHRAHVDLAGLAPVDVAPRADGIVRHVWPV